ncbi:MAG TPA: FAD-dependent oxidoreductase [Kofleriaceae bacterium]|jgi:2-polyprenyl-6-methoxyphenol hydroxylase-like FAD-dependent oxidoreductase
MSQTDVVICGAGATGLVLAIELARRGVAFRVLDKLAEPFAGSRGKGIQPRTQEIFDQLGVLDRVVAAGGEYPIQRTYADDGSYSDERVVEAGPATPDEPYHLGLLVPQFRTEAVLRERLAELGHVAEFGREVVALDQTGGGVTARVGDGEAIHARYLVGADGGRSFVRHALGIEFPGKTLGVRAVVADVELDGIGADAWHRFHEGDMSSQLSLCPLPGTAMFQIQAPIPLDGDFELSRTALEAFVRARSGRDLHVRAVHWASAFHMNARLADRYRAGRVLLAGDAAHVHPPTGGQGLNTSVQDAYNLGWKLAAVIAGKPAALLDSYEAERRPVAQAMLGLATKLLDAATRGDRRRGREVHQLDIGYPDSPLAFEQVQRNVLAGDRAPDAPIRGAGGQPRRLFELFGAHWTAIGWHAAPIRARANLHVHAFGRDLVDDRGHFAHAYALEPGDWLLVRPDGYIGAIARDAAAIDRYLQPLC